jgi:hypothetical protein
MPQSPVADHVLGEKQDMLAWMNGHLRGQKSELATSVEGAMANGITLIKLTKDILHEDPPRYIANPLHLFQRVENLQICMKWLKDRGVHVPNIHIEDLTSGNVKSCLALCRSLMNYEAAHSGGKSPHKPQSAGPGSHSGFHSVVNLDKDDIAVLGWLGTVLEKDITNYQLLADGLLLCQLVRRMAPGSVPDDILKRSGSERLEAALSAAETHLSISRGLLDIVKLSQGREDNYKIFSYLQRCQITYKQKKRQEYLRMEKEKATSSQLQGTHPSGTHPPGTHPPGPHSQGNVPAVPMGESRGVAPFGAPEMRDSRRSQRQMEVNPHIKPGNHNNGVSGSSELQRSTRSGSPGRRGDYTTQWASKVQQQKERGALPGSEHEGDREERKSGGNSGGRSHGPKIYPPPYDPPPPPPQSTSGGEQHPHYASSILPRGPSFRQKGAPPTINAPSSPLLAGYRSKSTEDSGFPYGEKDRPTREERVGKETSPHPDTSPLDKTSTASEGGSLLSSVESVASSSQTLPSPSTHPHPTTPHQVNGVHTSEPKDSKSQVGSVHNSGVSEETDSVPMSVLRQHLQSSSHPQHVQSHFLSRLELLEHELSDLQERLDIERVQYTHRLQTIELEERKKREELEKETKKLADLARQLMKHYDNCFVGLARQIAFIQDKIGVESDDTVDILVGDHSEGKKSSEAKQLIEEISSLKQQIQSLTSKPLSGNESKDDEVTRRSSGSSPPSSLPNTPEPPITLDGQPTRATSLGSAQDSSGKKILFVRKSGKTRNGSKSSKEKINVSVSTPTATPPTSLAELAQTANITKTSHKKLRKFFGEDLPHVENLNTFLTGLGYPELIPVFSKEKVTLNELQLMNEQHLSQMGIPMGPRVAILAEIRSLEGVPLED